MKKATYSLYQVDAFADSLFKGNPAAVVIIDHDWLDDKVLLQIAEENAVAETAFIKMSRNGYHIRWFTPEIEMDLCGHATLAAGHVLIKHLKKNSPITFHSGSGVLRVNAMNHALYQLDFPLWKAIPSNLPKVIREALSIQPIATFKSRDFLLVYPNEEEIKNLTLNLQMVNRINLDPGGIIVTAPGNKVDFVSRFFTPQASIFEDPVTGSAHCTLIPYWAKVLNKKRMVARQLSKREGTLKCILGENRVFIAGKAITYYVGKIAL